MLKRFVSFCFLCVFLAPAAWAEPAPEAKNVILMIADGAGFNAFRAGAYYQYGDYGKIPQADFPVHLGMTTFMLKKIEASDDAVIASRSPSDIASPNAPLPRGYNPNTIWQAFNNCQRGTTLTETTDSAPAATAMNTGVKTTNGRVNIAPDGKTPLTTFAEIVQEMGKAVGIVTSVQVSHATPAGVAAHNPSRNNFVEIFNEMVLERDVDVIFGAGHPLMKSDPEYKYVGGEATWNQLTSERGLNGYTFIETTADFERLAAGQGVMPSKVVGIAKAHEHLNEKVPTLGTADGTDVPTLTTLSLGALNVLNQQPEGFYLMIEGGAIDWANHNNNFRYMLREQRDFNDAIAGVIEWVEQNSSWDETLLIVTADHETGQLWGEGAYTDLNNDRRFDPRTEVSAGFVGIQNRGQGEIPGHQYASGGHTNHLVPLWAIGPGSAAFLDLVRGNDPLAGTFWEFCGNYVDNTDVFRVMAAAVGATLDVDPEDVSEPAATDSAGPALLRLGSGESDGYAIVKPAA